MSTDTTTIDDDGAYDWTEPLLPPTAVAALAEDDIAGMALIGLGTSTAEAVCRAVDLDDLLKPSVRAVLEASARVLVTGAVPDCVTVAAELEAAGDDRANRAILLAYAARVGATSDAQVRHVAGIVAAAAARRRLAATGAELRRQACDPTIPVTQVITTAMDDIERAASRLNDAPISEAT